MYNGAQCTESMKRWMIRTLLCSCKCNVVTDPSIWKFITSLVNCLTLRARLMERRLKCSERWPNMHCIFCPSVLIELLLSMWCLISAVVDSSNSVHGQSSTDQHWKSQIDGVKVVKLLWVYKCPSLCTRTLIQLLFITTTVLLHDFYKHYTVHVVAIIWMHNN